MADDFKNLVDGRRVRLLPLPPITKIKNWTEWTCTAASFASATGRTKEQLEKEMGPLLEDNLDDQAAIDEANARQEAFLEKFGFGFNDIHLDTIHGGWVPQPGRRYLLGIRFPEQKDESHCVVCDGGELWDPASPTVRKFSDYPAHMKPVTILDIREMFHFEFVGDKS
jgi:hypothetical protein